MSTETTPAEETPTAKGKPISPVIKLLVLVVIIGGSVGAVAVDRSQCEEAFGKFSIDRVEYLSHEREYVIAMGVVVNRKTKFESWEIEFRGKTYKSTEEHKPIEVWQYGKEARRAGIFGSDIKTLYGASYRHFTWDFHIKLPAGQSFEPGEKVRLSGTLDVPEKGKVPFDLTTELN